MTPKPEKLADKLRGLHRLQRKGKKPPHRRPHLNAPKRAAVLASTASQCHICGGSIGAGEDWQVDHVYAQANGGIDALTNYLRIPAIVIAQSDGS